MEDYYYEEDYPDCYGEDQYYSQQPACLTCPWKTSCNNQIQADYNETIWESVYDY